jgi:hypothetical protein
MSLLFPLLTSARTSVCGKSVTWSLTISLHSVENTQDFRGLALRKLTIFTVVSVFQAVRHFLGSKSLSVDAAVYPNVIMRNCLHVRYHSTMSPCHGFCAISTDTNMSSSYVWLHMNC